MDDITGDGKADIVARDTSGNLWRNNGNGKGSFGGRTKIATGWQGYKGLGSRTGGLAYSTVASSPGHHAR